MANKKIHKYMLVVERFYNPVILVSLSSYQTPVTVGGICERGATCRGEKAATSLKEKAEFLQSLLERRFARKPVVASRNVDKVFLDLAATGFWKFCDQLRKTFSLTAN